MPSTSSLEYISSSSLRVPERDRGRGEGARGSERDRAPRCASSLALAVAREEKQPSQRRRRLAPVILRVVEVRVELADSCEGVGRGRVVHAAYFARARAVAGPSSSVTPVRTLIALALEEFQVFDELLLVVDVQVGESVGRTAHASSEAGRRPNSNCAPAAERDIIEDARELRTHQALALSGIAANHARG